MTTVREQSRSEAMITAIEATLAGLNGAEGAQRGYMISGDSAHLPRFHANLKAVDSALHEMDALAEAFPQAARQLENLKGLVRFRIARFDERLALYEADGLGALRDELQGDPEDLQVAAQAHSLETLVRGELAEHARKANRLGRTALGVIALGGVIAVLFMLLAGAVIYREHSERVNAYHALREEGLKNAQFLESLPLGVFVLKADGTPAYANHAAISILGRGISPRTRPQDLAEVYSAYRAGTLQPYPADHMPVVRALHGEHSTVEDMEVQRGDVRVPLQVSGAPVYASDGNIVAAIAAFTDITDRRAVERLKDELISIVSHELRTPLTSIRGALGLVGSGRLGTLNEQGMRMIDIATADTDRLVRLINDMLDIERMQAGRIELHMQDCSARDLVAKAVDPIQPLAARANVAIELDATEALIACDNDRIVQTLTNLIGNAIKFSPQGGTVHVGAEVKDAEVVFSVKDHGHGIAEDKLEAIFERFQQIDASDAREKGGAGLGLAIARSIVIQHGGRIWVESDGATGSTFFFTLPLKNGGREDVQVVAPASDGRHGTGDILIVEDDMNLYAVLSALFEDAGMRAFHAGDAASAISLAQSNSPALLVLDLMLPERDGYHVVEWLREHQQLHDLPVIVYTALELTDAEQAGLSLGPTVVLTKAKAVPDVVVEQARLLLDR
jgi:nitrogen-specific signal transduction histidine kinase/CheY-like chemotaxis protein/CHASE3 domain sensor protein